MPLALIASMVYVVYTNGLNYVAIMHFRLQLLLLLLLLLLHPAFVGLIYGNRLRYEFRFYVHFLNTRICAFFLCSEERRHHVHYGENRNCNPLFSSEMNLMGKLRTGEKTTVEESNLFQQKGYEQVHNCNSFNIAELEHHEHDGLDETVRLN